MADIILRIGSATENVVPERRQAIENLASRLRANGLTVTIEEQERIPGRYGLTWAEQVGIFVGSGVATTLINAVVTDVYNTAKDWARERFKSKSQRGILERTRPEMFTIYDSNVKIIGSWKINHEGEQGHLESAIDEGQSDTQSPQP